MEIADRSIPGDFKDRKVIPVLSGTEFAYTNIQICIHSCFKRGIPFLNKDQKWLRHFISINFNVLEELL